MNLRIYYSLCANVQALPGRSDASAIQGMEMAGLETIELETGAQIELGVIWLHGLGADGHDFEPVAREFELPFGARFVFPHAPVRPVTINGGMHMRAWYDILTLGPGGPEDEDGIRASAAAVRELIAREVERGLRRDRIVLAGFSQGGAIALYTATRETEPLAGVVALSTYLPLAPALKNEASPESRDAPILMAHGSFDPVIDISFGTLSRDLLLASGYRVAWQSYPIEHGVSADEIRDIGAWLAGLAPD